MAELLNQIKEDIKSAMRAKESFRLTTLRMLTAAIKQREVDERITITDTDILAIVNKMVKQRRDAAKLFHEGDRPDLAKKEHDEIDILHNYLPEQLSEEDIQSAITKAIEAINASGMKDMGRVMNHLKPQLEGRADMAKVSQSVKAKLN